MKLDDLRNEIDLIDDQLIALFVKRMNAALKVAKVKKENDLPVLSSKREQEILAKVTEKVGDDLDVYGRILYNTIFDLSRSYQNNYLCPSSDLDMRIREALEKTPKLFPRKSIVACQGIEGAFSQLAAEKLFDFPAIMYFNNFEGVFTAVEKGLCQYGVLPIENSSYGSVGEVYDLMRNYHFHIAKSVKLHVRHALLVKPGTKLSDIKEIFSHEQGLGQCSKFIKGLKGVKATVCENTAIAAQIVASSDNNQTAAISSKNCASIYGLEILNDDIQNNDNNYTRFICISKDLEIYPGASKVSLMISVPHKPMSLYSVIAKFSSLGLNLTKLESRPIPGSDFEFMFYFDIDASLYSENVVRLLCQLEKDLDLFVFLGNYLED